MQQVVLEILLVKETVKDAARYRPRAVYSFNRLLRHPRHDLGH
jgi:hypothetical protein